MPEDKGLTGLGKVVVFLFVVGCLVFAARMFGVSFGVSSFRFPSADSPTTTSPGSSSPASASNASTSVRRTGVLAEARRAGVLKVAYEADAPPMYFNGPDKRPEGFEFQLATRLGKEMGLSGIQFVPGPYADLPALVRSGKADVIVAGYVPDPSVDGIDWSESYLDFGLCLVVPTGSAVTELSHLTGKTVGVYDDPAAVRWVKENVPGAKVRAFSGETGWFEAVEKREVDALVYDYPFAAEEIKKHPRTKIVRFNLNSSRYAVGFPAANDDLLEAVNGGLARIKSSPAYGDLVRRFLDYRNDSMTKPVGPGRNSYMVKSGDTLGAIAATRLGSTDRWDDIWKLNRDRIPNPHLILPGYVLVMP